MPLRVTIDAVGLDGVKKIFDELGKNAGKAASAGLYEGAGVMADAIKTETDNIEAVEFHYAVFPPAIQRDPSYEEKEAVQSGKMGVAKFERDMNGVQTSVGFARAGYAMVNGRRKPIALIANAINSGTSFMRAQPFFRKAVSVGTPKATKKIADTIREHYERTINGGK